MHTYIHMHNRSTEREKHIYIGIWIYADIDHRLLCIHNIHEAEV